MRRYGWKGVFRLCSSWTSTGLLICWVFFCMWIGGCLWRCNSWTIFRGECLFTLGRVLFFPFLFFLYLKNNNRWKTVSLVSFGGTWLWGPPRGNHGGWSGWKDIMTPMAGTKISPSVHLILCSSHQSLKVLKAFTFLIFNPTRRNCWMDAWYERWSECDGMDGSCGQTWKVHTLCATLTLDQQSICSLLSSTL